MSDKKESPSRLDELEYKIVVLESRMNNAVSSIDALEERIDELEDENRELMQQLVEKVHTSQELEIQLSDAERIYHLGWDEVNIKDTVPRVRAMTVIENWKDWSSTAQSGDSITLSDLVERLDTVLSVDVEYTIATRVAKAMEDLSEGKFRIEEPSSGKVVFHNPEETPFAWELEQIAD